MTIAMVKLVTFFISNMTERILETTYLRPLYIWSVGTKRFVTDALKAGSVIPSEFASFVDTLEKYYEAFIALNEAVENDSDNFSEDEVTTIGTLRRDLSRQYMALMNARQTLSTIYNGIFLIPESLPGVESISFNMGEFAGATTEIGL